MGRELLPVWREVSRHIRLEVSIERLAPLVARWLPADEIQVRLVDAARGCLETVAQGRGHADGADPPPRPRTECAPADLERIRAWCRDGRVERGPERVLSRRLPGLVPPGLKGDILAGPLCSAEGVRGAVLLIARPPARFGLEHEGPARALLDPLAVALENDHRLRELTTLREAVEADNRSLLSRLGRHDITDSIVGSDTGLREVMEQIRLVAPADAPVLILGETGSGKEVVARAIHQQSRRAPGPFLRVNCGAIPPELVDSELFGHEKGSFTGAVGERRGWFERADGGTLFLDECGELPAAVQVRLLRILQDGQFERVGAEKPRRVDVRIVAATHRDLEAMIAEGKFRQDLWYRLAVFPIRLPPLRDRLADVPALAAHFALRAAKRLGLPAVAPTAADIAALVSYPWPGNVRELANAIERAAILAGPGPLRPEHLPSASLARRPVSSAATAAAPAAAAPGGGNGSLLGPHFPVPEGAPSLRDIEMKYIQIVLEKHNGNKPAASRELGISLKTLYNKINQLQQG